MKNEELRELDAFVAEHVMGWTWSDDPEEYTEHDRPWLFRRTLRTFEGTEIVVGRAYRVAHAPKGKPFTRQFERFHPTTDPAAALQVLEKCLSQFSIEIVAQSDGTYLFTSYEATGKAVYGETLPLAICRFARALFESEGKK